MTTISGYDNSYLYGITGFDDPEKIDESHKIIAEYEEIDNKKKRSDSLPSWDSYRDYELFDRRYDRVTPEYSSYDDNDVDLSDTIKYADIDPEIAFPAVTSKYYIETGKPDKFISVRTGETFYIPNITDDIGSKLNQYSLNDICNIYYETYLGPDDLRSIHKDFAREGFNMLDMGYPLEKTVDLMHSAKLNRGNYYSYAPGTLTFLMNYPDKRDIIIKQDSDETEVIDKTAMKYYGRFRNLCDNEDDADIIMACCSMKDVNGRTTANDFLCNVAEIILEKNHKLSDTDIAMIEDAKQHSMDGCNIPNEERQKLYRYSYSYD